MPQGRTTEAPEPAAGSPQAAIAEDAPIGEVERAFIELETVVSRFVELTDSLKQHLPDTVESRLMPILGPMKPTTEHSDWDGASGSGVPLAGRIFESSNRANIALDQLENTMVALDSIFSRIEL